MIPGDLLVQIDSAAGPARSSRVVTATLCSGHAPHTLGRRPRP